MIFSYAPRSLEFALLMEMRKHAVVYNTIQFDGQIAWTTVNKEL